MGFPHSKGFMFSSVLPQFHPCAPHVACCKRGVLSQHMGTRQNPPHPLRQKGWSLNAYPDAYPMHTRRIPRRRPRCSDHACATDVFAHAHVLRAIVRQLQVCHHRCAMVSQKAQPLSTVCRVFFVCFNLKQAQCFSQPQDPGLSMPKLTPAMAHLRWHASDRLIKWATAHYEYMALAKHTSVLREAMSFCFEPRRFMRTEESVDIFWIHVKKLFSGYLFVTHYTKLD